ncbi:MAG: glycosyltransferase family 9 protein, partial [Ignavibacteria bacterium]|nr:glycosyltransferase family 9 protein [Ignavibacteria bacterium]
HDFGVKLMPKPQEQEQLESIVEPLSKVKKMKIMVCPGSNWANKQLSKETLLSFLQNIDKKLTAHFILVWGNQSEKELTEDLSASFPQQSVVIDRLSLPGLQNLMTHVDLVIAMDSLPLHLAGTTSTPTYSVFGASSCQKYKPLGDLHEAYQGSCPYGKSFIKRCDVLRTCKTGACIKNLEGQRLFDHFFKWWSS